MRGMLTWAEDSVRTVKTRDETLSALLRCSNMKGSKSPQDQETVLEAAHDRQQCIMTSTDPAKTLPLANSPNYPAREDCFRIPPLPSLNVSPAGIPSSPRASSAYAPELSRDKKIT